MAGGGGGEGGEEPPLLLEYTPTWVVSVVCSVIVLISLLVERILHQFGKYLKKKNQKPLFEALQKVKEELMLLGFISLLLTVFQERISKICIPESLSEHFLPCKKRELHINEDYQFALFSGIKRIGRRLLAGGGNSAGYCAAKGDKVPLLSIEALHQLHIFIFVLAVVHVTFSACTILFGGAKIRQWKRWEDSIAKDAYNSEKVLNTRITSVHQHDFIKDHFLGVGKASGALGWLHAFFKQFHASVTEADYITLRLGFIMNHCRGNPNFDFHKYMVRAFEADFKKVVGISWYLWAFVVIFLLLNIDGWHTYFWIAFVPFFLLLAVGTKLEHVITQLAQEVAEKHVAIEGELVVHPSDDHFWFRRPKFVLFLIHFILFQNAFEIAFFFWILFEYGVNSCFMGRIRYMIPRLIIGAFIQVLCSYSTLPLYAIVTQMGTSFKKSIFEEHIQESLVFWAKQAKKRKGSSRGGSRWGTSAGIQMGNVDHKEITEEASVGKMESLPILDRPI